MKIADIKRHKVYLTTSGSIGRCEVVGGSTPPSVQLIVVAPLPRGKCYFKPREIEREVDRSEVPERFREILFGAEL